MDRKDLRKVEVEVYNSIPAKNIKDVKEKYTAYFHEFTTIRDDEGNMFAAAIVEDMNGNIKSPCIDFVRFID